MYGSMIAFPIMISRLLNKDYFEEYRIQWHRHFPRILYPSHPVVPGVVGGGVCPTLTRSRLVALVCVFANS